MPSLTVRQLDDKIKRRLRLRAARNGRSVEDEVRTILRELGCDPEKTYFDVPRMRTEVAGRSIDLTPTEFTLLATLARQPGRIFTRSQLLDALHGVAFESYERAIDSHIKNLRRKLEPDPRQPRFVLTVYGVGYRLADDR